MVKPLRFTDAEVGDLLRALVEHGEGSPAYQAALRVCTKRMADWVDEMVLQRVMRDMGMEPRPATE